jgi:hypothetical protein
MLRHVLPALALIAALLPASAFAQSSDIPYVRDIDLRVGQSTVIYGYIDDCGVAPTRVRLPQSRTGTLSVGRMGARESRRCGGRVPAVEIVFTGNRAGREEFRINEDRFTVRVRD